MGFGEYEKLVEIIGAKYKAGDPEVQEDFETLCEDILTATGTFKLDAEEKISAIIDDASGRTPRPEETDRKAETARARESVNALAAKYNIGQVFDPDPHKVAADMIQLYLRAISGD